jgi:hypothetical protein
LVSPSDFVKAANITVNTGATVNTQFKIAANDGPAPAFYPFTGNTKNLGNYTVSSSTTTPVSGNYKSLKIKKNVSVTITGTLYGEIEIEKGAKVTFNPAGGIVNIEELEIDGGDEDKDGDKDNHDASKDHDDYHACLNPSAATFVYFTSCTSIRIKDKVDIGQNTQLNVGGPRVTFYLGNDKKDEEKFTVKGGNTQVNSNIYIKDGKLKVNGCGDSHYTNTVMTGWFIAEKFESMGKNVIWNKNPCIASTARTEDNVSKPVIKTPGQGEFFDVKVLPNPSTTNFRILVVSYSKEPVTIRLMDASGRSLEVLSNLDRNSIIKVGDRLINGIYFAEVIQGNKSKIVTLIKAR